MEPAKILKMYFCTIICGKTLNCFQCWLTLKEHEPLLSLSFWQSCSLIRHSTKSLSRLALRSGKRWRHNGRWPEFKWFWREARHNSTTYSALLVATRLNATVCYFYQVNSSQHVKWEYCNSKGNTCTENVRLRYMYKLILYVHTMC